MTDYAEFHGIMQECASFAFVYQQREKQLIGDTIVMSGVLVDLQ